MKEAFALKSHESPALRAEFLLKLCTLGDSLSIVPALNESCFKWDVRLLFIVHH